MSERIRQLTGGHKCEHGMQRATGSSQPYAGPVKTCDCCRSPYGALGRQVIPEGFPTRCPGCSSPELNEIYRLADKVAQLELDKQLLLRELGRT